MEYRNLNKINEKVCNDFSSMDSKEFRRRGKEMIDYVADYLENIKDRNVFPLVEPGYLQELIPPKAPTKAEDFDDVMADVNNIIMPGITHWHHPHFHAYFPAANSYAAICGDILSGGIGCIGFSWGSSPACTELEVKMMDWLADMLQLPEEFSSGFGEGGGVIYNTCSEATLVALFAARNKAIETYHESNPDVNNYEIMGRLVGYYSDQAHLSVERAGLLSMIKMKKVPSINREMRGFALKKMIEDDIINGLIPFYCVATLGTTGSCAFDNLKEIGPICKNYDIWLHVDAAYAGSSFICPEFRYLLNGIQYALSFVFNPHKWLLVNFDCSAVWFRKSRYVVETFTVDATYLQTKKGTNSYDLRHWQIHLGRRFRSLKLWFVLRLYGVDGLQKYIRNHVRLAHLFESLILSDERFEIVEEVILGLVCFRLKGENEINKELYSRIEKDGKIHIVTSTFPDSDIFYLRFAVCYQYAEDNHVIFAYQTIIDITNKLMY